MKTINKFLIAYMAWLCRILAVGPAEIRRACPDSSAGFAPRPEGALGYYY